MEIVMFARIYAIDSIQFRILKSFPPKLVLVVAGRATSTGWTDAELGTWMYIRPPADGILDFDFLARMPKGLSLPVLTPIAATITLPLPTWAKGARVHAASNEMTIDFSDPGKAKAVDAGSVPWPWSDLADQPDSSDIERLRAAVAGGGAPANKDWEAWENQMGPGVPRLHVKGKVETTNGAIIPVLTPTNPDGHLFMAKLHLVDAGGVGTTDINFRPLAFDCPVPKDRFKEVRVTWQGAALASMPVKVVS
jgi:hypothetical protein